MTRADVNVVSTDEADRHDSCSRWAREGRCDEEAAAFYFMRENCRRSCRVTRPRAAACPSQQFSCDQAPTASIRKICEQLRRWDSSARVSVRVFGGCMNVSLSGKPSSCCRTRTAARLARHWRSRRSRRLIVFKL